MHEMRKKKKQVILSGYLGPTIALHIRILRHCSPSKANIKMELYIQMYIFFQSVLISLGAFCENLSEQIYA